MLRSFIIGLLLGGAAAFGWWFTRHRAVQPPIQVAQRAASDTEVRTANSEPVKAPVVSEQVTENRRNAITKAVELGMPAVVGVNVTAVQERLVRPFNDPFFSGFFPPEVIRQRVQSVGSGFLISDDGYLLTCQHVVENATEIVITLTGGKQESAKLIGSDRVSDVALLKIEGGSFKYLRFADSRDVIVGEWSIAMGNPFGLFNNNVKPVVTVGVVSTTGQDFDRNAEGRIYRDMIQTDAAINSGNSGGPLLNALGEVIGMNTMIYTPVQNQQGVGPSAGVGFAIPSNRLKEIIEALKRKKTLNRDFYTGLRVQNLDPRLLRSLNLQPATAGVLVSDVESNSPADKAGILPSDIITALDEYQINDVSSIKRALDRLDLKVGDVVTLKYLREGKSRSTSMRLEAYR